MTLGGDQPAIEISTRLNNADVARELRAMSGDVKQSFQRMLDDAKPVFSKIGDEIKGSFVKGFAIGPLVTEAIGLVKSAISSIVDFGKESILAAAEVEQAEIRLSRMLKLRGEGASETLEQLKKLNDEVERGTDLDGDSLVQVQAKLSAIGVLNQDLASVTKAVIGFSEKYGVDLPQAADKVGRAIVENRSILEKYGVHVKDNTELVRLLSEGYVLAEERATTLSGRLNSLKVSWGNLQETVGEALKQSGLVDSALESAKSEIESLTGALKSATSWWGSLDDSVKRVIYRIESAVAKSIFSIGIPGVSTALAIKDAVSGALPGPRPEFDIDAVGEEDLSDEEKRQGSPIVAKIATENQKDSEDKQKKASAASKALRDQESRELQEMAGLPRRRGEQVEKHREMERKRTEEFNESVMAAGKQRIDIMITNAQEERRVEDVIEKSKADARRQELALMKKQQDEEKARIEEKRRYWSQLGSVVSAGVSNMIGTLVAGVASGEKINWGRLFGGFLVSIGNAALQMGTVAVLAGTLGTVAPWLAPATGGPAGIVAGLALIAGGIAAVAAGSVLGGRGGGAGISTSASSGFSPSRSGVPSSVASTSPSGFNEQVSRPSAMTINVSLGRGMLFGTPRQLAREIEQVMGSGRTLRARGG